MLHQCDTHFNSHKVEIASSSEPQRRHQQAATPYSPPAATEVETASLPLARGGSTNRHPRGQKIQQQVSNRVPVKENCPNHIGVRQDAGEIYADMNNQFKWIFHINTFVTIETQLSKKTEEIKLLGLKRPFFTCMSILMCETSEYQENITFKE